MRSCSPRPNGDTEWHGYLTVGSAKVGLRIERSDETVSLRYFHTDHLGSIAAIADENGAVSERLSYDAWGKRRYANGADDPTGSVTSETKRGFTGHEHLDEVGLVHMNGRLYDPLIARMVTADPIVPDAMNSQSWNRYSYVGNDPLTFTDPTGHSWLSKAFKSIGNFFKRIGQFLKTIVNLIIRAALVVVLNVLLPGAGMAVSFIAAAAGAAIMTGINGGKIGDMLKAAVVAGITAIAFHGAGLVVKGLEAANEHVAAYVFKVASHAGIGCVSSAASGGSCGSGAAAAAVGAAATPLTAGIVGASRLGGVVASAMIGGVASVAAGGSFENGAVTAAFGYLYNHLGHMLRGVDAHYQLLDYLKSQPGGARWSGNITLLGLFGDLRPDLTYQGDGRTEIWEIKPVGQDGAAKAQLALYEEQAELRGEIVSPGENSRIFREGETSFRLNGGWFSSAQYEYYRRDNGVVTYKDIDGIGSAAGLKIWQQWPGVGPLPLPPKRGPFRIP